MPLQFRHRRPGYTYIGRWVWVPRGIFSMAALQAMLQLTVTDSRGNVEVIRMWRERVNHIGVPWHFLTAEQLTQIAKTSPIVFEEIPPFETIDYDDGIDLWDDQVPAFQALCQSHGGTVKVHCGGGKTVIGVKYIAFRKAPALVTAPAVHLLTQWHDHLVGFDIIDPSTDQVTGHFDGLRMDPNDIGWIAEGTCDWQNKKVVLATIQAISQKAAEWPPEFCQRWGTIIYDETHHMSAPHFSQAAPLFWGVRVGFSATPEREDGTEGLYYNHIGPPCYVNVKHDLVPHVILYRLDTVLDNSIDAVHEQTVDINGDFSFSKFRVWLAGQSERNSAILQILHTLEGEGRKILVLSHSVEHVVALSQRCPGSVYVHGQDRSRDAVRRRVQKIRNAQIAFATNAVAEEGLDDANLDTVFFATPFGNRRGLIQGMGRILRKASNKHSPLVVIFDDHLIKEAHGPVQKLLRHVQELGFPFEVRYHNPQSAVRAHSARRAAGTMAERAMRRIQEFYRMPTTNRP